MTIPSYKLAEKKAVTRERAIEAIQEYIKALPEDRDLGFKEGDVVKLDTGWIGIVHGVDPSEGTVYVCYLDDEGIIHGPAFGFELEHI